MRNKFLYVLLFGSVVLSNHAFAKELKIHVNGMVCAFCAQGITKKFEARPEVAKIDVNLKDKIVLVTIKDKQDIQDDDIKNILKESGFAVEKIERNE